VRQPRRPEAANGQALEAFRAAIKAARKPVVIAGGDVLRAGAREELRRFAEGIEAAVLVTMEARGVFPESHGRWAGVLVGTYGPNIIESELMAAADLVVHVGVDSMMTHVTWTSAAPVIELAESPDCESLCPSPRLRVDGDLKLALRALAEIKQPGFAADEVQAVRRKVLCYFQRPDGARLAAQDVIAAVREALPREGALVTETGAFVCMLEHLWPVDEPGTYYGTSGGRTMGLMVPAVLGAKLARPDRPMIGLGADGSLLMRLGELEVFARTGVSAPLVIIDDAALGTMKSRQKSRGLPDYGLDLHPVDFAQVARACGLRGVTARDPEELRRALAEALSADATTLIDARVDPVAYQDSFGPTIGVLGPA
jgi:acetolactate synthase-1/2/3 large subunit